MLYFVICTSVFFAENIKAQSEHGLIQDQNFELIDDQDQNIDYYGSNNQEALFSVQSYTFFGKANGVPSDAAIANDVKTKVKYILGYMRRNPGNTAAIYPSYTVSTVKIESTADNKYKVTYKINAKGVFNTGTVDYTFLIPISHSTVYQRSQGLCTSADAEKVSADTFWYHWSPTLAGCPLVENTDYIKYYTTITPIKNTVTTYPEYNRLFQNGTMNVSTFFGVANYDEQNWNPYTTSDLTGRDFIHQRELLINTYKMSSRVWSESEVRQYYNPGSERPLPYIEEFSKLTSKGKINFRLFFGNTGLDHDSSAFHVFLKIALSTHQVILYNGHSGLGKNLNIPSIETTRGVALSFNQNYQLFYFGSCVPYSYYTDMYFKRKANVNDPKGTKNLDIITFGDESYFSNHYDDRIIQALFFYADKNIKQTYQAIIGNDTRFHFGINGDEDNPTLP